MKMIKSNGLNTADLRNGYKMNFIKPAALLVLILMLLSSCTAGKDDPVTEKATEASTAAQTVSDTEAAVPDDDLAAPAPTLADGFAFSVCYKEPSVSVSNDKRFRLGDLKVYTEYESEFYGSESLIKRDSHVLGSVYKMARHTGDYPLADGYYFGSFSGDKADDMVTFADGTLKIYETVKSKAHNENSLLFSQKLPFEGKLCGTGDFNGDGFTDLLFMTVNGRAVIGSGKAEGFDYRSAGILKTAFPLDGSCIASGDINGDGRSDIIAVSGSEYAFWTVEDEAVLYNTGKLAAYDEYRLWCICDVNSDGVCDLVTVIGDSDIRTYFGKTGGSFGPDENDAGNKNLYPTYTIDAIPVYITAADINGDGNENITFTAAKKNAIFYLTYPPDAPAYDYSTHIIKTDSGYILYNGGRYSDFNSDKYGSVNGDHVLVYLSNDGVRWHRNLDAPAFYLGGDLGVSGEWWSGNTIEPEVIYVDGVYYMYWQCENYKTYKGTLIGADRIGCATSTDGLHFERHTESPVIVNDPEYVGYDHEEAIYVADDPDGKCFWLYVRCTVNNANSSFIRIRSSDPSRFDYGDAESVSGFSQLGNQTGYFRLDDGSLLFTRITFAGSSPTLQFSEDGLNWVMPGVSLAGVSPDADTDRKNCYFCGFATINGTGEIERLEDGSFTFLYGTCCSKSPVAPDIFYSNVGLGKCNIKIRVEK